MRCGTLLAVALMLSAPAARAEDPVKEPGLRAELKTMTKVDQDARKALVELIAAHGENGTVNAEKLPADVRKVYQERVAALGKIDRANTGRLGEIVDKYGWPAKSLVGTDGSHDAWLLAQHADASPKFQRRCLDLMAKLPKDEVSQKDVAYLTDRVLLAEGKKQVYGTQYTSRDGKWAPRPLEDEANVDKRRAAVGLSPLAEYEKQLKARYGGAKK